MADEASCIDEARLDVFLFQPGIALQQDLRRIPGREHPQDVFDRQPAAYKNSVLPKGVPRIAVEMGVTDGWWKYGCAAVVGIDTYGESAPAPALFKHFGFTAENVVATVRKVLGR